MKESCTYVCTIRSVITTCGNFCFLDWIKRDGETQPVDCRFFHDPPVVGLCHAFPMAKFHLKLLTVYKIHTYIHSLFVMH
jgi:hypothetical protein